MKKTGTLSRVDEARSLLQNYEKTEQMSQVIYWHKAKYVYHLKKDNLWKFCVGESVGSWAAFCAESLKCPAVTADHRAQNYEFFVVKHKFNEEFLSGFDAYALYYISMYCKEDTKEQVQDLMQEALVLGRRDLILNLQGKNECEHEPEEVEITICKLCHRKLKTHEKE